VTSEAVGGTGGDETPATLTTEALFLAERHRTLDLNAQVENHLSSVVARFAPDLDTAYRRFVTTRRDDPFPEIPPALLHSAIVFEYIAATGMLFDARLTPDTVKTASIDFDLLGQIVSYEGTERRTVDLQVGQEFILRKNAIAFVTLRPYIQLPDYIALRFNLRITNVYRGLLLGTGPLVDPGFQGRLSFPLHNLTNNEYRFKGGDAIVTVEFTKVGTPGLSLRETPSAIHQFSIPFPEPLAIRQDSFGRDIETYLAKTLAPGPILSSLVPLQRDLSAFGTRLGQFRFAAVLGLAGFIAVLFTLLNSVFAATSHNAGILAEERSALQHDSIQRDSVSRKLKSLADNQARLESLIDSLRAPKK
jgi:deoxycytidine triphosphate deaminase